MPLSIKLRLLGNFSQWFFVLAETKHNFNFTTMKKIKTIIALSAIIIVIFCINVSAEIQNGENQSAKNNKNEPTKVATGRDTVTVEDNDSALNVKIGDRGVAILESLEGPKFSYKKYSHNDDWYQDEDNDRQYRRRSRFRGHWAGIEFGFNNYATSGKSTVMPDDINYMTLNSGKSSNFNINFTQLSLGLGRHIGFVTGLGLNWNNYRFDGNNNIIKGDNGVIEELDPGATLEKSKLATLFLTVPFMLELQVPVHHNHLSIAAGPIGALKLSSHTKMVFKDGEKIKSNGDFSLNMLRSGFTGRVGYGNFQLYGTYYKTPLFSTGKGPGNVNLYPFEIGIALTFND